MESPKASTRTGFQQIQEFVELAESISQLALQGGFYCRPYVDPSLPFFSQLDASVAEKALEALRIYQSACTTAVRMGADPSSSSQMTWYAIKAFGFRPKGDLFDFIGEEDIVEFYRSDAIQIFRNFNWMNFSSYSIEELSSRPFDVLFGRDDAVLEKIRQYDCLYFNGKFKESFVPDIPTHVVKELDSPFKYESQLSYKVMSPLFDENGQFVAAAVVEQARLLNPRTKDEEGLLLEWHYNQEL